jgi:transposase-like protein
MSVKRKQHSAEFKAKVALEAAKGQRTVSELATQYKIHPSQITQWKKQLLDNASTVFTRGRVAGATEQEGLINTLYQQIGQLTVEVEWLKKKF